MIAVDALRNASRALKRPAEVGNLPGKLVIEIAIAGTQRRVRVKQGVGHRLTPKPLVEMDEGMVDIDLEQAADRQGGVEGWIGDDGRAGVAHFLPVECNER